MLDKLVAKEKITADDAQVTLANLKPARSATLPAPT